MEKTKELLASLISSIDRSSELLQIVKDDLLTIYDLNDGHIDNYVLDEAYTIKSEIIFTQQRTYSLLKKLLDEYNSDYV